MTVNKDRLMHSVSPPFFFRSKLSRDKKFPIFRATQLRNGDVVVSVEATRAYRISDTSNIYDKVSEKAAARSVKNGDWMVVG